MQEYDNRLQIMIDDKLLRKIDNARGDVPVSIFLRKILEDVFR